MTPTNDRGLRWNGAWRGWILTLALAVAPLNAQERGADGGLTEGAAALRHWVQPAFPEQARREKTEGRVVVDFVVEAKGMVTMAEIAESSAGMFEDPALEAVRQWTFAPALEQGLPAACGMTVVIEFPLSQLKQKRMPIAPTQQHLLPVAAKRKPTSPRHVPDPEYPEELEARKLPGEVRLEFRIDATGRVRSPRVLWASHAAFVAESLRAAEQSTFEPARQGILAKESAIKYPVSFVSFGAKRADILAANGLQLAEGESVDMLPMPFVMSEPVYPFERLVAREPGSARVAFKLNGEGMPTEIELVSASAPEFGAAMVAAVETWAFRPAGKRDTGAPTRMVATHEFQPPAGGSVARLTASLRSNGGGISEATGLDEKLEPLWRGFPAYPRALLEEGPTGEARIEFIIDRDGRARLIRVLSATRPEFGWAAVTAVSQWVFSRPRRAGVPVDVRARIDLGFTRPAS
ncbi:MAG: TonB family protein [Candidatus Didemnitutus sp.]|nr:TonB family protein [Candidatus Didemnitutus sp.]